MPKFTLMSSIKTESTREGAGIRGCVRAGAEVSVIYPSGDTKWVDDNRACSLGGDWNQVGPEASPLISLSFPVFCKTGVLSSLSLWRIKGDILCKCSKCVSNVRHLLFLQIGPQSKGNGSHFLGVFKSLLSLQSSLCSIKLHRMERAALGAINGHNSQGSTRSPGGTPYQQSCKENPTTVVSYLPLSPHARLTKLTSNSRVMEMCILYSTKRSVSNKEFQRLVRKVQAPTKCIIYLFIHHMAIC